MKNKRTSWNRKNLDIDLIKKKYAEEKISATELGKELNVAHITILKRLRELGIKTRSRDEAMKSNRTRKLISDKHLGIKKSIDVRKAISEGHKGLLKSEEHKKNISNSHIGINHTQETKKKLSEFRLKNIEEHPEERLRLKNLRSKQIFPKKDTSIELKIQNFLKRLNIEFYTHQFIKEIEHGYQCDIMIPVQEGIDKKTIIECFGNYWHDYPNVREIDKIRCKELRDAGWRVLVFWGNEVKMMELENLSEVISR